MRKNLKKKKKKYEISTAFNLNTILGVNYGTKTRLFY